MNSKKWGSGFEPSHPKTTNRTPRTHATPPHRTDKQLLGAILRGWKPHKFWRYSFRDPTFALFGTIGALNSANRDTNRLAEDKRMPALSKSTAEQKQDARTFALRDPEQLR